jgi:hypothetical protein
MSNPAADFGGKTGRRVNELAAEHTEILSLLLDS